MNGTGNMETIIVKGDAITLSLLVWRRFKKQNTGYLERVLDLNPGIADHGVFLPVGTEVKFPVDIEENKPRERNVVHLWD